MKHWKLPFGVLLLSMILGISTAVAFSFLFDRVDPTSPVIIKPVVLPVSAQIPAPSPDFESRPPSPPQSLPALSADAPPLSVPLGGLPPLPPADSSSPMPAMGSAGFKNSNQKSAKKAAPPPQDLSPPQGYARIERNIRQIDGVSSLAWAGGKTLHVLVRNASPASVARNACARANAIASGVRIHVQSVSDPDARPSNQNC